MVLLDFMYSKYFFAIFRCFFEMLVKITATAEIGLQSDFCSGGSDVFKSVRACSKHRCITYSVNAV